MKSLFTNKGNTTQDNINLEKMMSLKMTRKKKLKISISTIFVAQRQLLKSDPLKSAIVLPNAKIKPQ